MSYLPNAAEHRFLKTQKKTGTAPVYDLVVMPSGMDRVACHAGAIGWIVFDNVELARAPSMGLYIEDQLRRWNETVNQSRVLRRAIDLRSVVLDIAGVADCLTDEYQAAIAVRTMDNRYKAYPVDTAVPDLIRDIEAFVVRPDESFADIEMKPKVESIREAARRRHGLV